MGEFGSGIGEGLFQAGNSISAAITAISQHNQDKDQIKDLSTFLKEKGAFGMKADGTVDEQQNGDLFKEVGKMSVPGAKQVLGILAGQYIADQASSRQGQQQVMGGTVQKDVNAAQVGNTIAVETAKLQQQIDAMKAGYPLNARSADEMRKLTPVSPNQPTQPVAPAAQNTEPANQHSQDYLPINGQNVPVKYNADRSAVIAYFDGKTGQWKQK